MRWHAEALTKGCRETAKQLASLPNINDFYLAGGTALALYYGHRISVDLDFFSSANALGFADRQAFLPELQAASLVIEEEKDGTLHGRHQSTHVSFFRYSNRLLRPERRWEGLRLAHPVDIGLMKLGAIIGRGSRKDFIDLYVILQREISLPQLFQLIPKKFPSRRDIPRQALRALVYFADADAEPPPNALTPLPWKQVRAFFEREARPLAKRLT